MRFTPSTPLSFGLELELQIIDTATGRLAPRAHELHGLLAPSPTGRHFALEATLATIELNSGVHHAARSMNDEVRALTAQALDAAAAHGCTLRGGGTQVAQFWNERRLAPGERPRVLNERYGFLPKRFSTYGMHVHVGMPDGDTAVRVAQVLQAHVPLFIAASAASPFQQLSDTGFAAARPLESLVYPHGGPMPALADWAALCAEVETWRATGLVHGLKDLYWDVRPKPEFGTVEVRVFDTPLSVRKAVALAAFTRGVAALALDGQLTLDGTPASVTQRVGRFFACRDGMKAVLHDPCTGRERPARDWLEDLLARMQARGLCPEDAPWRRDLAVQLDEAEDHARLRALWDGMDADLPLEDALPANSAAVSARLLAD